MSSLRIAFILVPELLFSNNGKICQICDPRFLMATAGSLAKSSFRFFFTLAWMLAFGPNHPCE